MSKTADKGKTKKTPPPTSINMINRGGYGYGGGYAYGSSNSTVPDQLDQWGNTWTWDQQSSTFCDEYDNITGYGATDLGKAAIHSYTHILIHSYTHTPDLGSSSNPLISRKTNSAWQFDRTNKTWWSIDLSTNKRINSKLYPGKPPPTPPPPPKVVFTVDDRKWSRLAVARLGRQRGRVGFGNARAVRILFDKSRGEL